MMTKDETTQQSCDELESISDGFWQMYQDPEQPDPEIDSMKGWIIE